MNFFQRLFRQPRTTIECPRCLGKGHVNQDDIKRLGRELRWMPGKCAYCNGKGRVDPEISTRVPVDEAYLTNGLSAAEKKLIFDRDAETFKRMREAEVRNEELIKTIRELHFVQNHTAEEIVAILLGPYVIAPQRFDVKKYQQQWLDYVKQVIYQRD